ncbi:MAG: glycosyltransferase family 39 protein [Patescibacteria group bacterium]
MQSSPLRICIGVCVILALALLAFQLYYLDSYSIWHDEAFSGLLVQYDIQEMFSRISLDVHPPLYYLLLRGWTDLLGNTTFTLRLFSVLFGCIATYLTWRIAQLLTRNKEIALASAFLFFANSFVIQHNMEARMYTLGITLILSALLAALTALNRTGYDRWNAWGAFTLLSAAALYTHYYTVFYIIAIGIAVLSLIWLQKKSGEEYIASLKGLFGAAGLVGILYIPWLPTFLKQVAQVTEDYWIGAMTWWSIPKTLWKLLTGVDAHPGYGIQIFQNAFSWAHALYILIALLAIALYALLRTTQPRVRPVLLPLLFFPFIASALVSARTSIFLERYFIYSTPFLAIFLVVATYHISRQWIRNSVLAILLIGTAVSFPLRFYGLDILRKPGMSAAAAFLNENASPDDTVVVSTSYIFFTHRYYNTLPLRPLLLGKNLTHYSGTALIGPDEVVPDFESIQENDTIWKIDTTGFGNFQPDVPSTWKQLSEHRFEDMYDFRGTIIVREYTTPQ